MTVLNLSQIPQTINTVEGLRVWTDVVLQYLYPDLQVVEDLDSTNTPIKRRVIESNMFQIVAVNPSLWRLVSRSSIEINPNYRLSGHLWDNAVQLGTAQIPAQLLAA